MATTVDKILRLKRDPVAFISEVLIDPETKKPFVLYPAQVRFLREGLTVRNGRLPYVELLFSCPKKGGKTTFAAMMMIYVIVAVGGEYAEGFCLANDYEQAQGRVFQAIERIIRASPLLAHSAAITANRIEFKATGACIYAIASDYASAAGSNPSFIVFDELWGYVSESSRRLWDEMVPPPTRKVTARLTVSYAGFEGESAQLEHLYKHGLQGEVIGPDLYRTKRQLTYWTHDCCAPWQTAAWVEEQRETQRRNAFLRQIENRWVTSESSFVELAWWDACVDSAIRPTTSDRSLKVWVGVDASVTRDSTAIVACAFDGPSKRVRLVWHRVFRPSPQDPLDFEVAIEQTLFELRDRFHLRQVYFDPYQLVSVAQRLRHRGLPMVEFTQTLSNLTEASSNLYELIKGRNLWAYSDADMRLAVSRAVALETSRGWRITKEKTSHKIDVVVALAQAALGAVRGGQPAEPSHLTYLKQVLARQQAAAGWAAPPSSDPTEWHYGADGVSAELRAEGFARQVIHGTHQSQVTVLGVACTCGSTTTNHTARCEISRAAVRQLTGGVPG